MTTTDDHAPGPDVLIPRWRELRTAARTARENAYAPYSSFLVGAAVLCDDGSIVTGCNVENASYGLTLCAERVAICQAVAGGRRNFTAICISLAGQPVPCGACRQLMSEFSPEMLVLLDDLTADATAQPECIPLSKLFPRPFRLG